MNYNKYTLYSIVYLLFALLLSGCEVSGEKGPSNEESATRGLCQYWWSADYLDYDDANIRQEFIFSLDGTGSEIITRTKLGQTTTSNEFFSTGIGPTIRIELSVWNMERMMSFLWIKYLLLIMCSLVL